LALAASGSGSRRFTPPLGIPDGGSSATMAHGLPIPVPAAENFPLKVVLDSTVAFLFQCPLRTA